MLTALTGGDARAWATAPLSALARVLLPRVDDGRLAPPLTGRNTADGIGLLLALHRIVDVDAAFADLRHVLRPGGTLVVVAPSVSVRSVADLRWRSVLRPVRRGPWRHRAALDDASWLLTAADFAVLGDDRLPFTLPLPDADAARRAVDALPAAGLWPDLRSADRVGLTAALVDRAGPGCLLPVPLRRLVARR
jgi:SAM-dependent methyltransferase